MRNYVIARERGEDETEKALLIIEQLPIAQEDATKELTLKAARIKARSQIAYADASVAAMAPVDKSIKTGRLNKWNGF